MKRYLFISYLLFVLAGVLSSVSCSIDDDDFLDIIESNESDSNSSTASSNLTGSINGHTYVDLGLSVKWATCNVGASSPEMYGNYYAWGETLTRYSYYPDTYKFYNSNTNRVLNIGNNISGTKYDAASLYWGNEWRMPTYSELEELLTQCSWIWTTRSGVEGYSVVGKNGQSIFYLQMENIVPMKKVRRLVFLASIGQESL